MESADDDAGRQPDQGVVSFAARVAARYSLPAIPVGAILFAANRTGASIWSAFLMAAVLVVGWYAVVFTVAVLLQLAGAERTLSGRAFRITPRSFILILLGLLLWIAAVVWFAT